MRRLIRMLLAPRNLARGMGRVLSFVGRQAGAGMIAVAGTGVKLVSTIAKGMATVGGWLGWHLWCVIRIIARAIARIALYFLGAVIVVAVLGFIGWAIYCLGKWIIGRAPLTVSALILIGLIIFAVWLFNHYRGWLARAWRWLLGTSWGRVVLVVGGYPLIMIALWLLIKLLSLVGFLLTHERVEAPALLFPILCGTAGTAVFVALICGLLWLKRQVEQLGT